LALSIAAAHNRVYISNSYFIPDNAFCTLLEHAASRGVDVRILTAGPSTDVATTRYASRHRYDPLLRAGVRIYEYLPAMMHAKTIVVDGRWSSVGTMNFDNRSMELNDESNLLVLDRAFGARMDSVFQADLRLAHEVTLQQFDDRPRFDRVKEALASLASRVL
jgi:cardiolipin synthase